MSRLPQDTYDRILELCRAGDAQAEKTRYGDAMHYYGLAWGLLPDPKTRWRASLWILAAIGDMAFLRRDWSCGRQMMRGALEAPGGSDNPFVFLRLGQCNYELGDVDAASEALHLAYAAAGDQIFCGEDPKFIALVRARLSAQAS